MGQRPRQYGWLGSFSRFPALILGSRSFVVGEEVLCKFLCPNLTCLIQEQETLGITPIFWKDEEQENGKLTILPFSPLQRNGSNYNYLDLKSSKSLQSRGVALSFK